MTVLEIKNYLKTKNSVIIPVGGIEQHGHHLPTFTDSYLAEGIASRVAERLDILYAPVLYASYSGGCLPGTINFNPNTLILCLKDMCASLALQGFRNIFIMLGHGGSENIKVMEASLPIIIRENPIFDKVMIVYTPFWKFAKIFMKGFREGDGHGGEGETSMVMYLQPHLVMNTVELDSPDVVAGMKKHPDYYQKHEKPCDHPDVLPKITQKDNIRVGVMGNIGSASADLGKKMISEAVDNIAALYQRLLAERKEDYFEIQPELGKIVL